MVNRGRAQKPAGVAPASVRWRTHVGGWLRFRSPGVLVGGIALRSGGHVGHGAGNFGVDRGGDLLGRMVRSARRLFPERQILVRADGRVSYITLSRRAQVTMLLCGLVVIALAAYGITDLRRPHAANGTGAASALEAKVEQLKQQLADASARLAQASSAASIAQNKAAVDAAQARIKQLEDARDKALADEKQLKQQLSQAQDAASNRTQNLTQLNHTLDANRGELREADAQRHSLQTRIHQLESELETANARASQAKADLASNERRLQQLAAEHDKTIAERDRLQTRLLELQGQSSALGPILPNAAPSAPAAAAPAPQPQRSIADRPSDQRSEYVPPPASPTHKSSELERIVASTGIDVDRLLNKLDAVPQGEGGPFIPLDKKSLAAESARTEQLRKILSTLPLRAPLSHYELGSTFGPRIDPFNHRQAFHPGLDLIAPYRTPVYSTAPGTVIFTGVKEGYGKMVEIDHGHGIVTRYAHLHRITVVRGQKVPAHHEIGELGSTGRSTGPHLHYEVLVDGTALDPEKFLQAGKNVVQANGH